MQTIEIDKNLSLRSTKIIERNFGIYYFNYFLFKNCLKLYFMIFFKIKNDLIFMA